MGRWVGFKCASCCTVLSAAAVIFLSIIGALLMSNAHQLMEDITVPTVPKTKQASDAGIGAFIAAGIYLLLFLFCFTRLKNVNKEAELQEAAALQVVAH